MAMQSFLEVARDLVDDPAAKAEYADDPTGFLAARGFEGLGPEDVEDAVGLVADALPAPLALQLAGEPEDGAGDGLLARLAALEPDAPPPDAAPAGVDVASLPDPTGPIDLGAARATTVSGGAAAATHAVTTGEASSPAQAQGDAAVDDPADGPAPDVNAADSDFGTGAVAAVATGGADEETDEVPLGDEPEESDVVGADATEPAELDAPDAQAELPDAPAPPPPDEPDEIAETI